MYMDYNEDIQSQDGWINKTWVTEVVKFKK
jgi:hypothetical protein